MENYLHIVAFDIPVPINYGGAIDIYYKIKSLKELGVKIILHCYEYDRKPAPLLDELCERVYYYKREVHKAHLFKLKPYIVATRNSKELLANLLKDDYPILFEGLHTCFFLSHVKLKKRHKIVRTHNVEHHYYLNLAKVEKNIFRKYYFLNEAAKLKSYESQLKHAQGIAAISNNDVMYFSKKYRNVHNVSAFHPHEQVNIMTGRGTYALYHGSLDVAENNEAALFLVQKVFNDMDVPLIVAGNKISKELKTYIDKFEHIKIKNNVKTDEMYELIKNAHINILPTFQATGIKLKLLAALYSGRYCVVNTPMVINTGLESLCHVCDDTMDMKNKIQELYGGDFSDKEIHKRKEILLNNGFTNKHNAQVLFKILFKK